jgi:gamma-glutamyltranspeptidase/glutathione hydrolase
MVKGFLLNNELTDFSFAPIDAQTASPSPTACSPASGPRSSMSPTLVFEKNADGSRGPMVMSAGSPGGALIIHFMWPKRLHGVLGWGLNPQQAIDLPNFASLNGPSILEEKKLPARHRGDPARARRRGARAWP